MREQAARTDDVAAGHAVLGTGMRQAGDRYERRRERVVSGCNLRRPQGCRSSDCTWTVRTPVVSPLSPRRQLDPGAPHSLSPTGLHCPCDPLGMMPERLPIGQDC